MKRDGFAEDLDELKSSLWAVHLITASVLIMHSVHVVNMFSIRLKTMTMTATATVIV